MVMSQFCVQEEGELPYDVLRADPELWDLFTRREEYVEVRRDAEGRFPFYLSKNRDLFDPRVSRYLVENGLEVEYPEGQDFAICLTHDIDTIFSEPRTRAMTVLEKLLYLRFGEAIEELKDNRSKMAPFLNFREIMELEEAFGARSSFYFMVEELAHRYNYTIDAIADEVRAVHDRGWEVGLHGGHTTFQDPEEMRAKKAAIERIIGAPIDGYRNHYLKFLVPESWRFLREAGFGYDATFGYADCVGFRNGMCHPFLPYDLEVEEYIDIVELPLIIMDCSLDTYMRLDTPQIWEMVEHLLDQVRGLGGVCTILWHNTHFHGQWGRIYRKILEYGREHGAWMTGGSEISRWWRESHL